MISIIIPAYNEEKVILRCLEAMISGVEADEFEIIVSCNGCKDKTAETARGFSSQVKVLEIEEASKTAAINAAEKIAGYFPRFYIDADVVITRDSIIEIVHELESGKALLASPIAVSDVSGSGFAVKSFYRIWQSLPYNSVMVGTGVYVLTAEGRKRFDTFPEVIADDGFVRTRFSPDERVSVGNAPVRVFAPKTFKDLLNVKTRGVLGNLEIERLYPNEKSKDPKNLNDIIKALPKSIFLPIDIFIYLIVNLAVRINASKIIKSKARYKWARDDSTRL